MKDYLLQIKIKNGPMMNMMRLNGIETAAELHRASGVCQAAIGDYLNLKKIPIKQTGEWRESVLKIADFLKVLPDMLFPEQHITKALKANKLEGQVSFEDIGNLIDSHDIFVDHQLSEAIADEAENDTLDRLEKSLGTLAIRERKVLEKRFGINQKQKVKKEKLSREFKEVNLKHYPYSLSERGLTEAERIQNKSDKGNDGKTLDEVADAFSVTRQRIRQIEQKALRKLRHPSRMGKTPPIHVETQSEREEREAARSWVADQMPEFEEEPTQEEERKQAIERARTHGGRWHHLAKDD